MTQDIDREFRKGPTGAYKSKAQEAGEEVRRKIQDQRDREDARAAICACRDPVPNYPHGGQRWCRLCGKIVVI